MSTEKFSRLLKEVLVIKDNIKSLINLFGVGFNITLCAELNLPAITMSDFMEMESKICNNALANQMVRCQVLGCPGLP